MLYVDMETSLIGKALDFGPKECGFEPLVSKYIPYNSTAFLINHINMSIASRRRWILFRCTKKMIHILHLFKRLGLINSFLLINTTQKHLLIKLSPLFYKSTPFFKSVRLVSTPSKRFNLKLKTLQILEKSLGETTVILETSQGIITHRDALKLKIGGKILFVLS